MIEKFAWVACLLIGLANLLMYGIDGGFASVLSFLVCSVVCLVTCDNVWEK